MVDDFITWFRNCLSYLGQLLFNALCQGVDIIIGILAWILVLFIVILISPIWVLPFIYWFVFVRNKEGSNE